MRALHFMPNRSEKKKQKTTSKKSHYHWVSDVNVIALHQILIVAIWILFLASVLLLLFLNPAIFSSIHSHCNYWTENDFRKRVRFKFCHHYWRSSIFEYDFISLLLQHFVWFLIYRRKKKLVSNCSTSQ